MSDEVSLPTEDDLKRLTRRALVAYAVRAALRVEPLFRSDDPDPAHVLAVWEASKAAVAFVGATGAAAEAATNAARAAARACADANHPAARAARAAAHAVDAAHEGFTKHAGTRADDSATHAADAAENADTAAFAAQIPAANIIAECRSDYEKLLEMSGDAAGELGEPFDVHLGPLGPLWSKGEPEWFRRKTEWAHCVVDCAVICIWRPP